MQLKITIIENDTSELNHLIQTLQIWSQTSNVEIIYETFSSGEQFFHSQNNMDVQLYILDIELGEISGLEIAHKLRETGYTGQILFLTAFREFVFEGYNVHALNYLLKPITLEKLSASLNEVMRLTASCSYTFQYQNMTVQLAYSDILAFAVNRHYVDITTLSGNTYCEIANLKDILPMLPSDFIQCHRSYIVNMAHIQTLSRTTIILKNKLSVPIGRSFLNDTRACFSNYLLRFH